MMLKEVPYHHSERTTSRVSITRQKQWAITFYLSVRFAVWGGKKRKKEKPPLTDPLPNDACAETPE
jgi:hypothetical protein